LNLIAGHHDQFNDALTGFHFNAQSTQFLAKWHATSVANANSPFASASIGYADALKDQMMVIQLMRQDVGKDSLARPFR